MTMPNPIRSIKTVRKMIRSEGFLIVLAAEQETVFVLVVSQPEAREGLQLKGKGHREIIRARAMIAETKGQRASPVSKIAIHRVILFLERAVARFEVVRQPHAPVLVEFIIEAAEKSVVVGVRPELRTAPKITMSAAPAPG